MTQPCEYAWFTRPTAEDVSELENSRWVDACQNCCALLFLTSGEKADCVLDCHNFVPPFSIPHWFRRAPEG